MHAGNFDTLEESVEFYTKGRGHAVPEDEALQLHWHIWEPNLSKEEVRLIVEFLGALTDESLTPVIPQQVPSGRSVLQALQIQTTLSTRSQARTAQGEE